MPISITIKGGKCQGEINKVGQVPIIYKQLRPMAGNRFSIQH
jgi:hypothetical protein